jgi:peptidoglycan/xylan/chitin deacetylase (PgdA/CDA1 family)
VLRALEESGVAATFFVSPRPHPLLVEAIAVAGHEVAYHCGTHVRHSERTRAEVAAEAAYDRELFAHLGLSPKAWRPPWGDLAPWTEEVAAELDYELWTWSDDTEDWSGIAAERMRSALAGSLTEGSVVLMHDGIGPGATRTDVNATIELVPELVELCRDRGLRPGPINEPSLAPARA